MHQHYGIDLQEPGLLKQRTGRWLRVRILGLLDIKSRLHLEIFPPKQTKEGDHGVDGW